MARKDYSLADSPGEVGDPFQEKKKHPVLRWLFEILLTLLFAALAAVLFFQSVIMQESAMEPTLQVGQRVFVNRLAYRMGDPKRNDIIAFKTNGSDDAALHIMRVIALPGETVQIRDGRIYINGDMLVESADYPSIANPGLASSPVTLETGEYFVLGDNRNNSEDSRYGDIGLVKKKYIVGRLWFTIAPVNRLGFI